MKRHILAAAIMALASSGAAFAGPLSVHEAVGLSIGKNSVNISKLEAVDDEEFEGEAVISPVPLPAAGWMLLAGLGGIVSLRRRAKA
jgi:hypothetical protein